MALLNNHAARFRRGLSSANPFTATGRVWCPRCQQDVDQETLSRHQGTVYAWKQRCKRCGDVISRGVYDSVPVLTQPTSPEALVWSTERGEDRS